MGKFYVEPPFATVEWKKWREERGYLEPPFDTIK
jgi:hypothetical protein